MSNVWFISCRSYALFPVCMRFRLLVFFCVCVFDFEKFSLKDVIDQVQNKHGVFNVGLLKLVEKNSEKH